MPKTCLEVFVADGLNVMGFNPSHLEKYKNLEINSVISDNWHWLYSEYSGNYSMTLLLINCLHLNLNNC